MLYTTLSAIIGIAAMLSLASPLASSSSNAAAPIEPCYIVSKILEGQSELKFPSLDPQLVYNCLLSVPLDVKRGLQQLDGLKQLLEFQSTLKYLERNDSGSLYPAVDLMDGVDTLISRLDIGAFLNEYDFQVAIYYLFASAHDGHLKYIPKILSLAYLTRSFPLVSLSKNGHDKPSVFVYNDWPLLSQQDDSGVLEKRDDEIPYNASAIVSINSQPIQDFLKEQASLLGSYQDPDANYNACFLNLPSLQTPGEFPIHDNLFETIRVYPGSMTSIGFDNKTVQHVRTKAIIRDPGMFKDLKNGSSLADQLKIIANDSTPKLMLETMSAILGRQEPEEHMQDRWSGYLKALVSHSQGVVAGYFIETIEDYEVAAVLSIPSFYPSEETVYEFESVVEQLLKAATQAGKTRLIVDLRGNGGDNALLGYSVFHQLFPTTTPFGGVSARSHPLLNFMGQSVTQYYANSLHYLLDDRSDTEIFQLEDGNTTKTQFLNTRRLLNKELQAFSSWKDLYGPHPHGGIDNFTAVARFNLTLPGITHDDPSLKDSRPQPFAAENITILQDGLYSSTCATFSEAMKSYGGVRQIVVGGRPRPGPMQGVGGVKGSQVWTGNMLIKLLKSSYEIATPELRAKWTKKLGPQPNANLTLAVGLAGFGSINILNSIRKDDKTYTPLQFVYEAADCRFWYTPKMLIATCSL